MSNPDELWHHADVTPISSFERTPRSNDRVIAGVAAGWAQRWRAEPTVVRACVGVLALVGGLGLVLYGIGAALSVPATEASAGRRARVIPRRNLSIAVGTAAIMVVARSIGIWPGDGIMLPAAAVGVGVAVAWSFGARADGQRAGLRIVRAVAGVALVVAGVVSLANRTGGLSNVGASVGAIAIVLGGIAMFAAPAIGRLVRSVDDERAQRIREDERAAVAAHLHDSVLQSLVLIQRSDDSRRMASLARRQERELRAWLYGVAREGEPASLHEAVEALAVEVERDHDVRVEAVVVGDQPLDDAARALVAAVREALVNAARHAGVDHIDAFVEVEPEVLTGFVRDTGRGFDRGTVPGDRHGISESIVGRAQRAGGSAAVMSRPAGGTEVEIRIPRQVRR